MSRFLIVSFFCLLATPLLRAEGDGDDDSVSASAVIREMNLARQNPALYATFVEEMGSHFVGNIMVRPGHINLRTKEGLGAIDDAVRFLRSARPLQPLTLSPGMCRGAADHCADQAGGAMGHGNPSKRMNRYGMWGAAWGENIAYGQTTARQIVLALIIDDGLRARKHRKNIFNPNFNYAGAGYGRHARFGSVCSIDFAGSYAERGEAGLVARNF